MISNTNFYDNNNRHHEELLVDLILKYTWLLSKFVEDLYESIKHFTKNVEHGYETVSYIHFGHSEYIEIAAVLMNKSPAAFRVAIKESSFGEVKLKNQLYYASKQHDYKRRCSCLKVLSKYGELTQNLLDMIIDAILSNNNELKSCAFECITNIHETNRDIIEYLLTYLKTNNLDKKYLIIKILVNLARNNVMSINEVQDVIVETINDPKSKHKFWDATTNEYYSRLDHILYIILIQLSDASVEQSLEQYDYKYLMNETPLLKDFNVVKNFDLNSVILID
ncbi:unnamed protein product [Didymodactylos carnosus]|nr:unnamed protein product [Didymodactylos carnosus]CAF4241378.1 unnamed protein product [Didymodactylos carnosus]